MVDLVGFKSALYSAIETKFGWHGDESNQGTLNIPPEKLPWFLLTFGNGQNSPVQISGGFVTMEIPVTIDFAVGCSPENAENAILAEIGKVYPWLSVARQDLTAVCVINSQPQNFAIKEWSNTWSAGGGTITGVFTIRSTNCP